MNGSAINAYSGVFDPRSVGRQDYKYFIQKNRAGNVKRFSKIKLNLFIDDSGSFKDSENVVNSNKLLFANGFGFNIGQLLIQSEKCIG